MRVLERVLALHDALSASICFLGVHDISCMGKFQNKGGGTLKTTTAKTPGKSVCSHRESRYAQRLFTSLKAIMRMTVDAPTPRQRKKNNLR